MSEDLSKMFTTEQVLEQAKGNVTGVYLGTIAYLKEQHLSPLDWSVGLGKRFAPGWEGLKGRGYEVGRGSFSDISFMSHLGITGFNFGSGSYDEHFEDAYFVPRETKANIEKFRKFLAHKFDTPMPFDPAKVIVRKPPFWTSNYTKAKVQPAEVKCSDCGASIEGDNIRGWFNYPLCDACYTALMNECAEKSRVAQVPSSGLKGRAI